jgi:hypothetical protein
MQGASAARATPSGRTVALFGGFLLLVGLFVIAFFLLARAPRAGAQTDDSTTPSADPSADRPAPAAPSAGQEQDQQDRADAPESGEAAIEVPGAQLGIDALGLEQLVSTPPVTVQLPIGPALPQLPPVSVTVPGVRVSVAPLPASGSHQPPSGASANAPVASDATPPSSDAAPPPVASSQASTGFHARATSELRPADSSSTDGGTRAPPWDPSPITADGASVARTSTANDAGSSLLLLGVLAAGILLALGPGRRLRREVIGWLPVPWSLLPERPG